MKMYIQTIAAIAVGIFCLSAGWVPAQEVATPVPTNGPWRPTSGKLEDLEKKAAERDAMAKQVTEMKEELERLRTQIRSANSRVNEYALRTKPSRLQSLESKALQYETLHSELQAKNSKIESLTETLAEEQTANSQCQQEIVTLRHQVEDLMNANTRLEMMQKSLQDSVEQLLLGNFEYYEVREGDTLSSIAESPLVYGDAEKAEWIRQANSRRVDDLDDLRPGEMLIIPRFPPSGKYEF